MRAMAEHEPAPTPGRRGDAADQRRSWYTTRRGELKNINRAWPDLHLPDGEGGTGSLARAPTHPASPLRLAE